MFCCLSYDYKFTSMEKAHRDTKTDTYEPGDRISPSIGERLICGSAGWGGGRRGRAAKIQACACFLCCLTHKPLHWFRVIKGKAGTRVTYLAVLFIWECAVPSSQGAC